MIPDKYFQAKRRIQPTSQSVMNMPQEQLFMSKKRLIHQTITPSEPADELRIQTKKRNLTNINVTNNQDSLELHIQSKKKV